MFLIALTVTFRMLLAVRVNFLRILAVVEQNRYNGLTQSHAIENKTGARPWRAHEAVMMAGLDVIVAGVSYLL